MPFSALHPHVTACLHFTSVVGLILGFYFLFAGRRSSNQAPSANEGPNEPPASIQAQSFEYELAACEDLRRRDEVQHESYLYNARQGYEGEREARKDAILKLEATEAKVNIFTPLQWRALELAKDLQHFLNEMPPPQTRNRDAFSGDPTGTTQYNGERAAVLAPYINKLKIIYARQYAGRVKALTEDLSIAGVEDVYLRQFVNEVSNHWHVVYIATSILKLAHQLDFPDMCKDYDSWLRS